MIPTRALVLLTALAAATPALAQTSEDAQNGRYSMTPAPNGFLRMDTRTGAVSLCTLRDGAVACTTSADERGALEAEIARLSKDNADLRDRLAQVTQQPGARRSDRGLPNAEDMDRALGFAETFMKRMMKIMREDEPERNRL